MNLVDVYQCDAAGMLYELLAERTKEQSISHKGLPTYKQHLNFFESKPYLAWYLIESEENKIGSVYLTHQREIGIFLFRDWQMMGFGAKAVQLLMQAHPGKFLANIAPTNLGSMEFFRNLGFKHIQNTYELEPK